MNTNYITITATNSRSRILDSVVAISHNYPCIKPNSDLKYNNNNTIIIKRSPNRQCNNQLFQTKRFIM